MVGAGWAGARRGVGALAWGPLPADGRARGEREQGRSGGTADMQLLLLHPAALQARAGRRRSGACRSIWPGGSRPRAEMAGKQEEDGRPW